MQRGEYIPGDINRSAQQKISEAEDVLRRTLNQFGHEGMAIEWTGDNCSTVMLWICRNLASINGAAMPRCIFVGPDDDMDEARKFAFRLADQWGIQLYEEACLSDGTVRAVATACAAELPDSLKPAASGANCAADRTYLRIEPLQEFSERDIWDVIIANEIPVCPIYGQGFLSLNDYRNNIRDSSLPAWQQILYEMDMNSKHDTDEEMLLARLRALGYM